MKLGFIGLGRMGGNMVARLVKGGHEVVVAGRNLEHVRTAAKEYGAQATGSYEALVRELGPDPVVWLMVPSGAVEDQLATMLELLPKGGTIVDGGNSDYRQTMRRAQLCADRGIQLVDCGTSGGILGATAGYCLMVGGERAVVEHLEPLFHALARDHGYGHFGPTGAGITSKWSTTPSNTA
jgi:6-phosphogluconate dehydrogenase